MTLEQFMEYHKNYESKRYIVLINESKMDDDSFLKGLIFNTNTVMERIYWENFMKMQ